MYEFKPQLLTNHHMQYRTNKTTPTQAIPTLATRTAHKP